MSGANEPSPSPSSTEARRSPNPYACASEAEESNAYLAELLARGAMASGVEQEDAEELGRAYLKKAATPPVAHPDTLDPLGRHAMDDRAGPPTPVVDTFADVLGAIPTFEPGTLPSPDPTSSESLVDAAVQSPQMRPRKRDQRRVSRRKHDRKRVAKLREKTFADAGQEPDVPEYPLLRQPIFGMNLNAMRDGTGRKACALVAKLPMPQHLAILRLAYACLPKVRAGRPSSFTRSDLAAAAPLPEGAGFAAALEVIKTEVMPTEWFRKLACAAWGMWGHRGKALSKDARQASRGGVFTVEGFCQNALSWLVPKADGTCYSRTTLWGPTGPFALLGAEPRRLGRTTRGESGAGLWTKWQAAAGSARFKGPTRFNPETGKYERWAVGQSRYDEAMTGRSAVSLAKRARGKVRELAQTLVAVLMPGVKLAKRVRKVAKRPEEAEEAPSVSEGPASEAEARGPP